MVLSVSVFSHSARHALPSTWHCAAQPRTQDLCEGDECGAQTLSSHSNHEYTQITVAREEEGARARSHQQLKTCKGTRSHIKRRGKAEILLVPINTRVPLSSMVAEMGVRFSDLEGL